MAVLKYLTKGGLSPQGLPRVYFCCHPMQQRRFLEPVAKALLDRQSCAVFYLEDPFASRDEDLWEDMKQIQLFVIPVTAEFLTTDHPAMEEFRFAVANHIPVLPLMQECDLGSLFREKCGDLQYLDPNDRDTTAISYEEKLTKYLQSVLIGDELAEKIRTAFDAYVFLSYRKKDRRYAQELMRLIHKNDFCRDIAIWYDEFLTPGENFNDSIRQALEKSSLFVLTVTPNLVNEANYIMTTEYPMARTAGKTIIPAEMVRTNRWKLRRRYKRIPACTKATDEAALTATLLEAVQRLAIRGNDASAEHNFLIGLAYLGGVDVEVDHERAVTLITGAAEARLPEAMKKLVSMYREGLGVRRNYQTAIHWQRKLTEYYRQRYEQTKTVEAGCDYMAALWDLGDYIYETRQIPEAGEVFSAMLDFCQRLAHIHGTNNLISRYLSAAYHKTGRIYEAMGKLPEALSRHKASLELTKQLVEETGIVWVRRDMGVSYTNIGDIYRTMGKLPEAMNCYEAALALHRHLAEETGTVEARRDLGISCHSIGRICEAKGELAEALRRYEATFDITKQLAEETGTVEARQDLGISYDNMGRVYQAMGKYPEALSQYEAALELRKRLVEETGTVVSRRALSVSYHNVGRICEATGKLTDALSWYEAAFDITKQLAEETGTVEARQDLGISYDNMGRVYQAMGKYPEALSQYEAALELDKQLAEETGTVEARWILSVSYNNLGSIYEAMGRLQEALSLYEAVLELYKQLAEETGTVETRRNLRLGYKKVAAIYRTTGNWELALSRHEAALELAKQLAEETGTVEDRWSLSVSYNNLGRIYEAMGRLQEALSLYEAALEQDKQLAEETGTEKARRNLSISYDNVGYIYRKQKKEHYAQIMYQAAMWIRQELAEETETEQNYHALAVSHYNLGGVTQGEQQQRHYWEACRIWDTLARQCPDNPHYRQRRDAMKRLLNQ